MEAAAGDRFPTTRWTLILSARQSPEMRRAALEELLGRYWKPLYLFARYKGVGIDDAQDAVQGFFAHLLERDFLARLDPERGRFPPISAPRSATISPTSVNATALSSAAGAPRPRPTSPRSRTPSPATSSRPKRLSTANGRSA
jgi:RNA polymerase sigma-70 factor (ECF subfamily)